ncbi:hypothetical protein LTR28_011592, partial [Elasticomyces elasticus]
PPKQDPRFSFLEEKQPVKAPATLKEQPISQTVSGRAVPAVPKPNAGRSYNPDFTAWDELVTREGDKEVEAERKRLADARADEERTNAALAEAARPEPSSDNDAEYESAWESEWEGIQSEAEAEANLKKKRPERKTQADRNKLKRRKEAERTALHEKQMKRREEQQKRIREISKAVAKEEMARRGRLVDLQTVTGADSSADEDEEEVLRRRKFGKIHIPPAPLALVLADELQDSLRALRPEGNLLRDRFRHQLVSGKVEARRAITQPKMARREYTEKWTYKDWPGRLIFSILSCTGGGPVPLLALRSLSPTPGANDVLMPSLSNRRPVPLTHSSSASLPSQYRRPGRVIARPSAPLHPSPSSRPRRNGFSASATSSDAPPAPPVGNEEGEEEDAAGVGEDDEDAVEARGPEGGDDGYAGHAAGLEDGAAEGVAAAVVGADSDGVVRGRDRVVCRHRGHVRATHVRRCRVREAGRVVHRRAARCAGARRGRVADVLREQDEPADAEQGGVDGVDGAVEGVEPGQREALQRRLEADVRREVDDEGEGEERVD